jgi:cytidine deaminase
MKETKQTVSFIELDSARELPDELQQLLMKARGAIDSAYAPYSQFKVGAAVLLDNGEIITGSNQENASSPAGICAERVALSAASAVFPGIGIKALAISARADGYEVAEPVAPCGICRQTILEYEYRFKKNIEIVLQGDRGKILKIDTVKELLPLNFNRDNLKR